MTATTSLLFPSMAGASVLGQGVNRDALEVSRIWPTAGIDSHASPVIEPIVGLAFMLNRV